MDVAGVVKEGVLIRTFMESSSSREEESSEASPACILIASLILKLHSSSSRARAYDVILLVILHLVNISMLNDFIFIFYV